MSESSKTAGYAERFYRQRVRGHLEAYRVVVQQTDLNIYSDRPQVDVARDALIEQRGYLETYIHQHPLFLHTLKDYPDDGFAPGIVRDMIQAGRAVGVGPMAAVAGAVSEKVGQRLLASCAEVVIENGGDIFLSVRRPLTVGIFAGSSPLSMKIGLRIPPDTGIQAVCTSSGTVGHSRSFGKADAVCVLSHSCALADAAATALGNRVHTSADAPLAIAWGRTIPGLQGILVIVGEKMAAWGQIEMVDL
jgi:ApbE superfamily uncharacterized protein (UPF0280 family)